MPTRPRLAALLLIACTTVLRLVWAGVTDLSNDEAYHWLYTVHPALSYFDHPPMTMWVESLGLAVCGGWLHPLSLRLGFVLLFAGSTWILFRWTAGRFGETAGFWAAVALNLSGYFTAFGGCLALPDSPFLFFALLTAWQATEAVERNSLLRWLVVGLAFGGAMLSKYHGVLLPAGIVLFAVLTPAHRKWLWSPGPYLAALIGLLMFAPVVVWNAEHEWASFRFQGGRARGDHAPLLHEGPLKWLAGPILYLLPWIWFWLVVELVRQLRRFRSLAAADRLAVCLGVVPLALFFVVSCLQPSVLFHWPLMGFIPLYPFVGRTWAELRRKYPVASLGFVFTWAAILFVFAAVIIVQVRSGGIVSRPGSRDPAMEMSGWPSVGEELDRRGFLDEPDTFLFTNMWYESAQVAFTTKNRLPVACYHSFDARGFAFWSQPADYVGRTGFFVIVDEADEGRTRREYAGSFASMTVAAEFDMTRGGRPFRRVKVYRCEAQVLPYPFAYVNGGK